MIFDCGLLICFNVLNVCFPSDVVVWFILNMWKKVYIEHVVTYEDSLDIVIKRELMELMGMMTLELYYGFTKVYDTHKG